MISSLLTISGLGASTSVVSRGLHVFAHQHYSDYRRHKAPNVGNVVYAGFFFLKLFPSATVLA